MGRRGPSQKPTEMKLLEGNPGQRPLKQVTVVNGQPVCPDHLEEYDAMIWRRIVNNVPPNLYGEIDSVILSAYCIAAGWHRKAALELALNGAVQVGIGGTLLQSPWIQIMMKQANLISALGSKLGLDPASRNSMADYEAPKTSKFGSLLTIESDPIES